VTGFELDRAVRQQLRTLSKENAEGVAQHLVMVGLLLEEDPEAALAHAETAVRRAGRVAAAREALGLVAYRMGDWARALAEFRTARRLSGSSHLLPYMVDAERGLGRPERALELARSPEASTLSEADRVELAIVVSGIRRDLEQYDAAVAGLRIPQLTGGGRKPWRAALSYAYADALLAAGRRGEARTWFAQAADADDEGRTDADDRLAELDGVVVTDLLDGCEDDGAHGHEHP
jgi:tetratricopeptide (TPR) repeat protein